MRNGAARHTAEGLLGGAVGTWFMNGAMRAIRKAPEDLKPPLPRRDPGEYLVSRIERWGGRPLPGRVRAGIAHALPWVYGVGLGGLLGLATAHRPLRSPRKALLAGALLGTAAWAVGYVGFLPATRLTPPVHRQGGRHVAAALLTHIAYGVVTALPILLIDRVTKRPWYERLLERSLEDRYG